MKVIVFAATNSRQSINKALATHASELLVSEINKEAQIEVLDLNDFEMPIYSVDREEATGIPEQAHQFYNKITEADAIIVSFAEHNGGYTAAFKNVFDWSSRIDQGVYQNKAMALLATSPGPGGAASVLGSAEMSAPYFAADVRGTLSIPSFYDNFNMETGQLNDQEIKANLLALLGKL